jgi:membrane-bound metal-dependent hydrolase YbcI (DUF457 family)
MPFTPYHFGPGLLLKSALGRWFSIRVFVLANVVTDVESLYFLATNGWPVHRVLHSYAGATVVALACVGIAKLAKIATPAAVVGAFLGTYSHVVLDSIMHRDMSPLAPFTDSNGLLRVISIEQLHLACVLMGLLGIAVFSCLRLRGKMSGRN